MFETDSRYSLLVCAAAIATFVLTGTAEAEAHDFGLEFHAGGQHAYDSSFDAFGRGSTPNVFTAGTLGATYRIGEYLPLDGLQLYGAFGWARTGGPRLDSSYEFDWQRNLYLVGAEYSYTATPAIRPFARVTAGVASQSLSLRPASGPKYSQRRVQFATRNSLGIEFRTPFSRPDAAGSRPLALSENIGIGLTAEAGYTLQPRTSYDTATAPSGDGDPWRRSGFDLGTVDTSGWFWAFGGTLRIRL